jgi:K+/H+ antiporter YhaU regulatory subunit KhtT
MTIDERLEYIATLQQAHDDQIGKLIEQGELSARRIDALAQQMAVLAERTIQAMDAINRLAV